jgi:hypothetical protein
MVGKWIWKEPQFDSTRASVKFQRPAGFLFLVEPDDLKLSRRKELAKLRDSAVA